MNKKIDQEVFFSMVESFHLDFILAIMIHVGQRDSVSHRGFGMKYFTILLVSLFTICLVSLYLFMAYTVSRITESKRKYFMIKVKEMEDEPYRFWLEDKKPDGNAFQRHFNLIMLLKDIFICSTLYGFYYKSHALISVLSLMQLILAASVVFYPPYIKKHDNALLIISQVLYSLLNFAFIFNIFGGDSISVNTRYYFVGFTMIGIVMLILVVTIGFSLYLNISSRIKKCKKKKEAQKVKAIQRDPKEKKTNGSVSQDQQDESMMSASGNNSPDKSELSSSAVQNDPKSNMDSKEVDAPKSSETPLNYPQSKAITLEPSSIKNSPLKIKRIPKIAMLKGVSTKQN